MVTPSIHSPLPGRPAQRPETLGKSPIAWICAIITFYATLVARTKSATARERRLANQIPIENHEIVDRERWADELPFGGNRYSDSAHRFIPAVVTQRRER